MIKYSVSNTPEDIKSAWLLLNKMYAEKGYSDKSNERMPDFLHYPETIQIHAMKDEKMVGTLSIVQNGPGGLPMETIFAKEVNDLKGDCPQIAELSQFAVKEPGQNAAISFSLISHAIYILIKQGISCTCFTVSPKHALSYAALGAKRIGEVKTYPFVNDAKAAFLYINLANIEEAGTKNPLIKKILKFQPSQEFIDSFELFKKNQTKPV